MSDLTHTDKLDLNRRARAHGLPDLWPEEEAVRRQAALARLAAILYTDRLAQLQRQGAPASFGTSLPSFGLQGCGYPTPWLPPSMGETASEAVARFRREGGLTIPSKGFLRRLFGLP